MEDGRAAATRSTRGRSTMFRTLRSAEPVAASEQSAYDHWLDRTAEREEARNDRIHGAVGRHPAAAVDRALPQRPA